jgi:hypothetical protein
MKMLSVMLTTLALAGYGTFEVGGSAAVAQAAQQSASTNMRHAVRYSHMKRHARTGSAAARPASSSGPWLAPNELPYLGDPKTLPPPELTEVWSPVPMHVTPAMRDGSPPSDAIVLFDGATLNGWETVKDGSPAKWHVDNGDLVVTPGAGDIRTSGLFGDVQLHVEWMPPAEAPDKVGQDRGNSGVYLQGLYEVQVLETFENITYPNGQAGSIYKQFIPLVNASRPAGQWESYDIVFTAPRFNPNGTLLSPARMTVFQNGILVQNNVTLKGPTVFRGPPHYTAHGDRGLVLQDHGHEVRFRNIWLRRL